MIRACIHQAHLRDDSTIQQLQQKLEQLGFVKNVAIDCKKGRILLDYATFRDMDSITTVLSHFGITSIAVKNNPTVKKKAPLI